MLFLQAAPKVPSLPGGQVVAFVLLDLAIILIAARLVGALFVRIKQPRVVGEIVAGVLLGPTLLGAKMFQWDGAWAGLACEAGRSLRENQLPSITTCLFPPQSQASLQVIGQLALALFMFLVGLEMDWKLVKGKVPGVASVAFGVVAVPVALGFVLGPILYDAKWVANFADPAKAPSQAAFSLMVGAMLSVTAFPVAVRILQEKGLVNTQLGGIGIAGAAVVTVLMFLMLGIATAVAADAGAGAIVKRFVGTAIFLAVAVFVVRPLLVPLGKRYLAAGKLTGDMFAVSLVVMLAGAYVADRIGINVIVGAFIAGTILPARERLFADLSSRLSEVTIVFLLPVFLAFSGLNTDFTTLGWGWVVGIVLFVVAAVLGKWLSGLLFGRLGGLTWSEANVVGWLMNCRGLLVLVVALAALQAGVISPQMQAGAVLVALITTGMTGPLVDRFMPSQKPTPLATLPG